MAEPKVIRARIRRWYVANAIYFVTAVTHDRRRLFSDDVNVELLRSTMHAARELCPFRMHAYAFLPDHLHMLVYVPAKTTISKLMHSIQRNFTLNYKKLRAVDTPTALWQRGFWDHVIRDERDYDSHFDYIHYNPVKHHLVDRPGDYAHSSFGEYVRRGWYGPTWSPDEAATLLEDASEP